MGRASTPAWPASPTIRGQLVLLGLGTSLGVVLQGVALIPSLRAANLGGLRWHWNLHDAALRTVLRLSGWTFGFVVANQIALFVIILLAGTAAGTDPVSSYTYAYAFMQMPYGIVAVTVMSVVAPDLAAAWSTGRPVRVRGPACRRSGAPCWRSSSRPPSACSCWPNRRWPCCWATATARRRHGRSPGAALAMFALGLPGFCSYLYIVRVLQSMQRTKVAFYLYLVENAINIGLAVALVHPLGVRGLALSLSVAYTVGALLGPGAAAALVRPPRHRRDLDAAAPGGRGHGGHGRRGAGGVQSLGRHARPAPVGPCGRRGGGRARGLRRGGRRARSSPAAIRQRELPATDPGHHAGLWPGTAATNTRRGLVVADSTPCPVSAS